MILVKTDWLNAATTVGDVSSVEEVLGATTITVSSRATGSPTNWSVSLQGSVDGQTWFTLADYGPAGPGAHHSDFAVSAADYSANGRYVKYLRLRLATLIGGSSPTVSASILAL